MSAGALGSEGGGGNKAVAMLPKDRGRKAVNLGKRDRKKRLQEEAVVRSLLMRCCEMEEGGGFLLQERRVPASRSKIIKS